MSFADRKVVVLGVSGGIAAYKAVEIASALVRKGADVRTVLTRNAARLVGPVTFQAVTGNPVVTSMFHLDAGPAMAHIDLASIADLMLIAPATADVIAKMACGIADDALTTTVLCCRPPLLVAPAMNAAMWTNPAVRANVEKIRSYGMEIIGPESGRLACGEEGTGRLAKPELIAGRCLELLGLS